MSTSKVVDPAGSPRRARRHRRRPALSSSSSCTSTSASRETARGQSRELTELAVAQGGDDEKHSVRTHHPRASATSASQTVKSFRSTGRARRRPRCGTQIRSETPEELLVGEDRQAACPALFVAAARAAGSRPGARSPLEGERLFISAITTAFRSRQRQFERLCESSGGRKAASLSRSRPGRVDRLAAAVPVGRDDARQVGRAARRACGHLSTIRQPLRARFNPSSNRPSARFSVLREEHPVLDRTEDPPDPDPGSSQPSPAQIAS